MALISTVAGYYTKTWNAVSVGETQDGFMLRYQFNKELITADRYGDSVFDAVYRGGNAFLTVVGIQYNQAITSGAVWPYSTTGLSGTIGRSDATTGSEIAKTTVLTAGSGTTAAASPATLTSLLSILREDTGSEFNMNNRLRKVPLEFRLYLHSTGSGNGWFTMT